jgi:hypothetical protein
VQGEGKKMGKYENDKGARAKGVIKVVREDEIGEGRERHVEDREGRGRTE